MSQVSSLADEEKMAYGLTFLINVHYHKDGRFLFPIVLPL